MSSYTLYQVQTGTALGILGSITDCRVDANIDHMLESGDSNIDMQHVSVAEQTPRIRFSTAVCAVALAQGFGPFTSTGSAILYFRKRFAGAQFAGASSHLKMTIANFTLHITGVRASQGRTSATVEFELVPYSPSGAVPIVIEKDQTLDAAVGQDDGRWTVGSWWVNETRLDLIQDFSIDVGVTIETLMGSGFIWPVASFVTSRTPMMRCTTLDTSILDADSPGIGLPGVVRSLTPTDSTRGFLRNKATGGGTTPETDALHIRFDIVEGRIAWRSIGGAHQQHSAVEIEVIPTSAGVTFPIAVNTAVIMSAA